MNDPSGLGYFGEASPTVGQAESCPSRLGWFLVGATVAGVVAFLFSEPLDDLRSDLVHLDRRTR